MATTTASPSDSLEDRRARGEEAVRQTPLSTHAESPPAGRETPWSCWSSRTQRASRISYRFGMAE